MQWLHDLPIKRKLALTTLLTAGVSLSAALLAFFGFQIRHMRDVTAHDLSTLARVVADNAAGPLAFGDRKAAESVLASLQVRPEIVGGRLADQTGSLVVDFGDAAVPVHRWAASDDQPVTVIDWFTIRVARPVTYDGEVLGSLSLEADLHDSLLRLAGTAGGVLLAILAGSLCLAYFFALRLQGVITRPVSLLADAARDVAERKDYTRRAAKVGTDEIGHLTDAFNAMLEAVHERDAALHDAQEKLSDRVAALQHEVRERERAEAEMQKAKEVAEAASRAKSAFLATMSHEIRTPMNGVLGMANMLLDTPLNAEQGDFVRVIRSSGESLLNVINDILDFSKIEAGRLDFETVDFDLRVLVEDSVQVHAVNATNKGVELVMACDPALQAGVRGDPHRVRQVITNLVGNAIKFTAEGAVVVTVKPVPVSGERRRYRFEIRDSGIGIEPEAQAQLFQPFVQADSSTTRRFGGTGLGLAICRRLVESMDGAIGVSSSPGQGSTFWFEIELAPTKDSTGTFSPDPRLRGRPVLVIEANPDLRAHLTEVFTAWGMRCQSVAAVSSMPADLLYPQTGNDEPLLVIAGLNILDTEPIRFVAPLWERLKSRPVTLVVLASMHVRLAADSLRRAGIAACLSKPVGWMHLLDTVRDALHLFKRRSAEPMATAALTDAIPLKVLLAEDNIVNQKVATLFLRRAGCQVEVVPDGGEAVAACAEETYDLVLMDCQMPGIDGFEATRRIRQAEVERMAENRRPAFIVAMTANAMQGDRERCLAAGMDDYLSKPFKPSEVHRVLEETRVRRKCVDAGDGFQEKTN